jgi:hypothetical protein
MSREARPAKHRAKAFAANDQQEGVMFAEQDQFDAMDDQSLLRYLENVARKRDEQLEIGEVVAERQGNVEIEGRAAWVAETLSATGLAGRRVVFRGGGADKRAAMLDLARRLPSND